MLLYSETRQRSGADRTSCMQAVVEEQPAVLTHVGAGMAKCGAHQSSRFVTNDA